MTKSREDDTASDSDETWTVYRQGDDGNRFVVQAKLTGDAAERLVAEFEATGHKQHYWAELDPDSSSH